MARNLSFAPQNTLLLLFSTLITIIAVAGSVGDLELGRIVDKKKLGFKKEKVSHFKLYWHDLVAGPYPSAVKVVSPPDNSSRLQFGMVRMIDNALTIGPEITSKLVGRAQGLYAQASQHEIGFLMAMNFAFIEGKYNGSTITVFGRNSVFSTVREMPVIGGSGLFRFARGYVQARTHKFDMSTGDATVEYDIYVMHY